MQTCLRKVQYWNLGPYICTPVVFSTLSPSKRPHFFLIYATTTYFRSLRYFISRRRRRPCILFDAIAALNLKRRPTVAINLG